jgi:hypothetical protein
MQKEDMPKIRNRRNIAPAHQISASAYLNQRVVSSEEKEQPILQDSLFVGTLPNGIVLQESGLAPPHMSGTLGA